MWLCVLFELCVYIVSGEFNSYVRTVAMAFISAPFTEVCFDLVFLSLYAVHCVGDCGICTSNYWWNTSLHLQRGG